MADNFIAEDEDALRRVYQDKERMDEVGCIVVEFWRCQRVEAPADEVSPKLAEIQSLNTAVHEKALMGEAKYHSVA
jgi:hypothetical protein